MFIDSDWEKEFDQFIKAGASGTAIKDIYNIIPSLKPDQIAIINQLEYYAEKWQLEEIKRFINSYLALNTKNKNLSFLSSMNMKSLLKAYTTDEMLRGINVLRSGGEE